ACRLALRAALAVLGHPGLPPFRPNTSVDGVQTLVVRAAEFATTPPVIVAMIEVSVRRGTDVTLACAFQQPGRAVLNEGVPFDKASHDPIISTSWPGITQYPSGLVGRSSVRIAGVLPFMISTKIKTQKGPRSCYERREPAAVRSAHRGARHVQLRRGPADQDGHQRLRFAGAGRARAQVGGVADHAGEPADLRRRAVPDLPPREHPVGPQPAGGRRGRAADRPAGPESHRDPASPPGPAPGAAGPPPEI